MSFAELQRRSSPFPAPDPATHLSSADVLDYEIFNAFLRLRLFAYLQELLEVDIADRFRKTAEVWEAAESWIAVELTERGRDARNASDIRKVLSAGASRKRAIDAVLGLSTLSAAKSANASSPLLFCQAVALVRIEVLEMQHLSREDRLVALSYFRRPPASSSRDVRPKETIRQVSSLIGMGVLRWDGILRKEWERVVTEAHARFYEALAAVYPNPLIPAGFSSEYAALVIYHLDPVVLLGLPPTVVLSSMSSEERSKYCGNPLPQSGGVSVETRQYVRDVVKYCQEGGHLEASRFHDALIRFHEIVHAFHPQWELCAELVGQSADVIRDRMREWVTSLKPMRAYVPPDSAMLMQG